MNASSNNIMKVDDIKSMISTFSLQEIYNSFMSTIDCIFNTDNTDNYWDLTSKISCKSENDKIYNFLSPNGQLFDLILKRLTVDKSVIHFEFPIQKLSNYTQLLISTNSAPTFISSKLNTKIHDLQNAVLYLNAFEYYMFSFASYIYHPNIIKRAEWNGSTDSIYCQLLLRYLDFFFFNSRESCSLMQLALQSRSRSNFNQSFSWISPHFQHSQQNLSINLSNNSPSEIMLNRSRFAGSKDQKSVDIAELYYTETVLQTISEFWLNPVIIETGPEIVPPSVLQRITTRPTVDQVCLVRSLVKHCYHFSFAKSISTVSPDCQLECEFLSKLHFYRQQIVPKFVISKMQAYLESCFRTWPIDLSFRIVMETWLSAVQPWRYVDSYQHPIEHDTSLVAVSIPEEWAEFVAHNRELYCVLLLQFAHRLQRMDLAVARNAHMMFRVAKVLSHVDLVRFLVGHSESRFRSDSAVWQEIQYQISIVFVEIASVLARLDDLEEAAEKGWWRTIWEFLNSDGLQASDPKRVKIYLNQSRSMFANLLGIDCRGEEVSRVAERQDFLDANNCQAEHVITSRGAELTEFGRFQVANKLCKLSAKSKIYYYNRPTCSFEVDALVRLARSASNLVCSRYEDRLRASCYRADYWGRLCRYVLIGESRPLSARGAAPGDDDDTAGQLKQWVDAHPLHLRLRFLTTKAFLFWFFIIYLLIRLTLGLGMVPIVIGGCALYVLVGMVSVVILGFQ